MVSLRAYKPIFEETTPNLQSLQIAIDTVAVQPPREGMKRAVLFLTPHMDEPDIEALVQPLIAHAREKQVRVFVWFIDTELYATTASAAAFNTLATQTGGAFFSTTGAGAYPDPEFVLCTVAARLCPAIRVPGQDGRIAQPERGSQWSGQFGQIRRIRHSALICSHPTRSSYRRNCRSSAARRRGIRTTTKYCNRPKST